MLHTWAFQGTAQYMYMYMYIACMYMYKHVCGIQYMYVCGKQSGFLLGFLRSGANVGLELKRGAC